MLGLIVATFLTAPIQDQSYVVTVNVQLLKFDVASLAAEKRVRIKVKERDAEVEYAGVPLRTILAGHVKDPKEMAALRELNDAAILIRATDDYQTVVSASAVLMDEDGSRYLIALERNGQALDEKHAPASLVVPGDPKRVRWVRQINEIDLIRLPKRAAKPKP